MSLHLVYTLCRLRFVATLCPYALSKAKEGHLKRCLRLVEPLPCRAAAVAVVGSGSRPLEWVRDAT